jgi:hypothetical protein
LMVAPKGTSPVRNGCLAQCQCLATANQLRVFG